MTEESSWPRVASPGTLLGRMQRGLGSAAREVLDLDGRAGDVRHLLLSCVEADPRWDRQLDDRADYYAVFSLRAGVDVAELEALAGDLPRGDGPAPGAPLALAVLVRMAARGNAEAGDALRRYVAAGRYWDWAIGWLMPDGWPVGPAAGWPECAHNLAAALCERFPTAELMSEALEAASWTATPDDAPWAEWQEAYPLIRAALARLAERPERRRSSDDRYREEPTAVLLGLQQLGLRRLVATLLAERTGRSDVELMLRAVEDASLPMHAAAVNALARQQRTEVLPAVVELSDATGRGMTRALLFRAFVALPYTLTRSTAREWLTDGDATHRSAAASAMSEHAIDADVPLIAAELAQELDRGLDGDQYVVCSLAGALARHPEHGPFAELDRAFREMPYSFGRHHVVDAIAATDPNFRDEVAIDSLWDCEPTVRATGAKHARRENPVAAARLEEIRSDAFEDKDTRDAAA